MIDGVVSDPLNETKVSSIDNDHEIKPEIAVRRDHGIKQGEQYNRLYSLDVYLADNISLSDQSEDTQGSEEEKSSKIGDPDVPLASDQQRLNRSYGRAVTFLWGRKTL